ncbi:hypothetical protein O6H91_04G137100 [Diphasiastrum complanatum]|uniref:Uncharacterized protein n=1 Tax=Diphasiastrum complanatum TaxID=34168 RepID=A0ACC2E2I1_DIPCM|nr:hypothetical protein O6H91_Y470400 [Diphasiastrum complanatum]KAJ7560618.1 hypothetical protein O6H91_04G137100 [Diphasiastrum complanatum]
MLDFVKRSVVMGESLALITSVQPTAFALPVAVPTSGAIGEDGLFASISGRGRKKDDRIPQWGYHETRELILIRAELEKDFTQTKRNKTLWESIAGKMKEKGFRRSADQCKCKWKNLVNRYKGKEISEPDNGRQCPFFEELDAIFKERAKNINRLLLESESCGRPKTKSRKLKDMLGVKYSDDDSDEDDDEEESEDELVQRRKKRKEDRERQKLTAEKLRANSMQDVLEDFFQQQYRVEEQWREAFERREQERRMREQEWREEMEKLEQERIMREEEWRQREEQRRDREEARSQKRDELFAALFARLVQEDC